MFKLQSPSECSPCDAIHLSRLFFTAQNSFWIHRFWCHLVFLLFFVSPLPHRQNVSLWWLFSSGGERGHSGKTRWIGRVRHRGHATLVKNCWTLSAMWADINHPSWNGQTCWKSLQKKNSLKPNAASHNNTSWHADTDEFLEYSPSGGSLYY